MAVVLDDPQRLVAWQHASLERVRTLACADVVVLVAAGRPTGQRALAEALFESCDANRSVDASGVLPHDLPAEVPGRAERLAGYQLDVILDFSSHAVTGPIASCARYGVWRYVHGVRSSGPPCFWEVVAHDRCVTCTLSATLAGGEHVMLQEGRLRAATTYRAAVDHVLLQTADWVARACQEIRLGGWDALDRRPAPPGACRRPPGVADWLRFGLRHGRNLVAETLWTLFCYDEWNVGVVPGAPARLDELVDRRGARWLPPQGRLRYLADPFVVREPAGVFLLAERFDYREPARGHIVRVALRNDLPDVEPALAAPHHLSYPYVFSDGRSTYCLPEAAASGRCDLYRLEPGGAFVFHATLSIDRALVDPTVFRHEDHWWLLGTDRADHPNLKLFAYFAERLEGPWQPHALNPLTCDITGSRPAGPPFRLGGRLYRPAQDCSRTYGGAVVVNELEVLTPTAFRERRVLRIEPDREGPYPHGTHHLVVDPEMIVFDAKRRRVDPLFLMRQNVPYVRTWLSRKRLRLARGA